MKGEKRVIINEVRNRILELFLAGANNEEIRKELAVIVLGSSIEDIQRLRKQWGAKAAADREMIGDKEELEHASTMSYREITGANERWNRMMLHFECRRDLHLRHSAWITNVMRAEHSQRRKERGNV